MFSGHFFIALIIITISVSLIQWFFIGFLFHKYQAATPATWRKESNRSYAASMLLYLFFAFMFVVIFSIWKNKMGSMDILNGIEFGTLCWLTFSVPLEIGTAIYVNYSYQFVLGKCISSLVEYTVSGIIATLFL